MNQRSARCSGGCVLNQSAEIDTALAGIKDPDLALAMRIFSTQQNQQHQENYRRLEKIEETMRGAFANGDVEAHRRMHLAWEEMAEEKKRLRRAIVEKSLLALIFAGFALLGAAAWQYVVKLITEHVK